MGCVEGVLEVGAIGVALAELIAEGCEACEVEMGLLTLTNHRATSPSFWWSHASSSWKSMLLPSSESLLIFKSMGPRAESSLRSSHSSQRVERFDSASEGAATNRW